MVTTAHILAKIAIVELTVGLLKACMGFVRPNVEDHTRLAVIAAKLLAMAICHVLFAQSLAKSVAVIQNAESYVMNLVRHALRIVPGLVRIGGDVRYHAQCLVIYSLAQSDVQRY